MATRPWPSSRTNTTTWCWPIGISRACPACASSSRRNACCPTARPCCTPPILHMKRSRRHSRPAWTATWRGPAKSQGLGREGGRRASQPRRNLARIAVALWAIPGRGRSAGVRVSGSGSDQRGAGCVGGLRERRAAHLTLSPLPPSAHLTRTHSRPRPRDPRAAGREFPDKLVSDS